MSRPNGRGFFKDPWFSIDQIMTKQTYIFGPLSLVGPSDYCTAFERFYGSEWEKLALYYFSHTQGDPSTKYKWSLASKKWPSALPREPLEDRVVKLLTKS